MNWSHSSQIYIFTPCETIFYDTRAMKSKLRIVLFEIFQNCSNPDFKKLNRANMRWGCGVWRLL
jgi:hypothetical protein